MRSNENEGRMKKNEITKTLDKKRESIRNKNREKEREKRKNESQ